MGVSTVDLADLGNDGFRISAAGPRNDSGYSVSAAGDVNGDGFADIIVASSNASPSTGTSAGESYVIFGAKFVAIPDMFVGIGGPGSSYVLQGTTPHQSTGANDPTIIGNDTFIAGQGDATMYGNGGVDSFSGGAGKDTIHLGLANDPQSGFLKIDGGSGFDTLVLDGSGMTLDLTIPGVGGKIHNIERIDLGGGGNTLALDIHDVLNMSENSNTLEVGGGGVVQLSEAQGFWTLVPGSAGMPDTYRHNLATLLVDPGVQVHFLG